jgi:succinoglycan biosynthesis protein ExoM
VFIDLPPMPEIAICAITYRRPDGLARLLDGLAAQRFGHPEPRIEVIVVDNDAEGSAQAVYGQRAADYRWPIRYQVEPEPGIAQARNCALRLALPAAEFVAFIDDDEVPEPAWIAELLAAIQRSGADAVAGPVLPHFPLPIPRWIARGGFFDRERHPDGTPLPFAATNNVLIRRRVFERLDPWFDPRLGLSGGSDTLFFMRVAQAGFRIAWADRAEVVEWVPASRATAGWLLRRNFRRGNGYTRCAVMLDRSVARRIERAAKGIARVAQGVLGALVTLPAGRAVWMKHVLRAALGLGSFAAVFGYVFQEYRRRP